MYTAQFTIDLHKLIRITILAALLTVGSLNVTRCANGDDDIEAAVRDQYDRMNRIVTLVTRN